jgi:hypothetical protein
MRGKWKARLVRVAATRELREMVVRRGTKTMGEDDEADEDMEEMRYG